MNLLIIGGTRNLGYFLVHRLLKDGHRLTVLNRGLSGDSLPDTVARLRVDRTNVQQMRRALDGRSFDAVVDMVLFQGAEAEAITDILRGKIQHYIFISSGQVYLVRDQVERPFTEADYDGPLIEQPVTNTYDYEEWLYGMGKREAEDALATHHAENGFPYTSFRLPMVNSERDSFERLLGYVLRIRDGGPILIPDEDCPRVSTVYSGDIVEAIVGVVTASSGIGRAYNLAHDEMIYLEDFLALLGEVIGIEPVIRRVPRNVLDANGFLPDCSPFSDRWMSTLDNRLSKDELGIRYTPLRTSLENIVAYYEKHPPRPPISYRRRHAEKNLVYGET